jgi:hypothetical protein
LHPRAYSEGNPCASTQLKVQVALGQDSFCMIAQSEKRRTVANGLQLKQGLLLVVCSCLIFGAILLAKSYSHWSVWNVRSNEEERANAEFEATRIGTVVMNGPGSRCQRYHYDNDTDEAVPDYRPCDGTLRLDDRGGPPGADRRLDAISKSFLAK